MCYKVSGLMAAKTQEVPDERKESSLSKSDQEQKLQETEKIQLWSQREPEMLQKVRMGSQKQVQLLEKDKGSPQELNRNRS